ncbi:MAG: hypothetical protein M1836_004636 [Candelina mexicana]|nr:MAG: hypothetical protein M1836_004636 [Candelina mexicana]
MPIQKSTLEAIPICFASCSIGSKPSHTLPKKLEAIAAAGFDAIELSFPDILTFASQQLKRNVQPSDYDDLCSTGQDIKQLCESHKLKILILQPFANFEGWPADSDERKDAFDRAKGWIRIMEAVGTDMLQVGSSDSRGISTSREFIASDLRELADLLAQHGFKLAYENWCWSTHAPTWKDAWDIVQKVDRPNIGLCLDTFQTAGSEWADPTTESGLIEGPEAGGKDNLDKKLKRSLEELSAMVPPHKIYFLQISDAYKPIKPLSQDPDASGLRPRGRWSHDYRPMPFNGGYLPVVDITKAVLNTDFRGWFSVETFDGGQDGKGKEYDDMNEVAKKAMADFRKLLDQSSVLNQ